MSKRSKNITLLLRELENDIPIVFKACPVIATHASLGKDKFTLNKLKQIVTGTYFVDIEEIFHILGGRNIYTIKERISSIINLSYTFNGFELFLYSDEVLKRVDNPDIFIIYFEFNNIIIPIRLGGGWIINKDKFEFTFKDLRNFSYDYINKAY